MLSSRFKTSFTFTYHNADTVHMWLRQEFIEVMHMFGATSFTVYNRSSAANVTRLLNLYQQPRHRQRMSIHVKNYPIPLNMKKGRRNLYPGPVKIHDVGQIETLYDCWLRNIYVHKYVWFIDVDELPMLYKYQNFFDMINHHPNATKFMFLNSFFPTDQPDDGHARLNATLVGVKSIALMKRNRSSKVFVPPLRSKCMLLATAVRDPSVHDSSIRHGTQVILDAEKEGLLQHYRNHGVMWGAQPGVRVDQMDKLEDRIARVLVNAEKDGIAV